MRGLQAERIDESGAILAMLTGNPESKAEAARIALQNVIRGLTEIVPRRMAFPATLHGISTEQLAEGLVHEPEERPPYASLFAAYRLDVYRLEASNSARLTVLVGALRRITWLRTTGFDTATLDRYEAAIKGHMRAAWRLPTPPERADFRAWCNEQTRAYDLLPRAWRTL